ncbi:MAG: hypothetical protein JXJ17_09030 [Anaerolineae bacterium]|nr:hypothetical protein [Anaerolineae bacterium]
MGQGHSFRRIAILVVSVVFVLGCGTLPQIAAQSTVPTPASPATPRPIMTTTPLPTMTPKPSPTPTDTPLPSPTPTITPTEMPAIIETELEDGWYLYTLPEEGFSIAMPPDWYSVSLDNEMIDNAVDTVAEQDILAASYLEDMLPMLIAQGVKFYGIEISPEGLERGYPASINIFWQELPGGMSFERLVDMNAAALESMLEMSTPLEQEMVELPSGTAGRLSYGMSGLDLAGEAVDIVLVQYLIEAGEEMYIITVGTSADSFDSYLPTFDQIIESFRIDEKE